MEQAPAARAEESNERDAVLARLGTTEREAKANFAPCESFQGARLGYVFKLGVQGVGYYEDTNRPVQSAATASAAKRRKVSNPEEIDIGLDLEEMEIPSSVFGGLAT